MRIDIVTLFPGMVTPVLAESMLGRAQTRGLVDIRVVNLRDYAGGRHRVTDDYQFGGGGGMVLKPEPLFDAVEALRTPGARVVLMDPRGRRFTHEVAAALARESHLILLSGRYEGVDARVGEGLADEAISIGDYVLTGGELPALVVTDAVTRLLPGVLGAEGAAERESFADGLLEPPQYTRPEAYRGAAGVSGLYLVVGTLLLLAALFPARWRARTRRTPAHAAPAHRLPDRVEPPKRRQSLAFEFQQAPRSGDDVVSLKGVHKRYGSRSIYEGLDFAVRRKERWCVMGVNGAGKSTLLKLVSGSATPDDGTVTVGASVKMGYFAQHAMEVLDGDRTVFEFLEDSFPQAGQGSLRTLAGCFGFSGDDAEKKCRVLSGGEKARLVMAKMLYDPPNFLVLDEPTNHLDMATKEMLIAALAEYEGAMLFVSHDRHFLAALSNRVLELTPEGIHTYGGGYTEYVERNGYEAPGLRG